MRDVVWVFVGLLSGWRAFVLAQRDVVRLRATGETFGSGRATEFSGLSLVTAVVGALLWWRASQQFNHDLTVLTVGVLIAVGLRLLLIDIDTHLLPSGIVYRATGFALLLLFVAALKGSTGSVTGMLLGALIMWCVMKVLEVLSRGDLGGGDVKVSVLLGLYLGWLSLESVVTALVTAFVSAGLFAVILVALRRADRRTHIAFGPFLIAGTLFAVLR